MHATVSCREREREREHEIVIALELIVVMSCKRSINPITFKIPSTVTLNMWQLVSEVLSP
jgi:hypothetical protein